MPADLPQLSPDDQPDAGIVLDEQGRFLFGSCFAGRVDGQERPAAEGRHRARVTAPDADAPASPSGQPEIPPWQAGFDACMARHREPRHFARQVAALPPGPIPPAPQGAHR